MPGGSLRQKEDALQVDVHDRIPIGLCEVDSIGTADDAGIVDQDVELAKRRYRFVDDCLRRFDRSKIGLDGVKASTDLANRSLGFVHR